ncbi:ROK family protein [Aquimarina sediminis]|uniref:ROK family protein n=1 Tax=Aquimarina sediminis TaxID=2070536 RepID=UPI000CA05F63|nr:ROK family protein [Aquimarina sediminis]
MILGVDIGGNYITVAGIDTKTNKILETSFVSISVDSKAEANEILDRWLFALRKVIDTLNNEPLEGIGIAIPGPFDYHNGIFAFKMEQKYASLFCLNIKEILKKKLQLSDDIPIRFYNDAACFGIGEVWRGKLKSIKRGLGITLGAGFGATFLFHGLPLLSGDGIPKDGELYHITYKDGIADDYFSTRWFVKRYKEITDASINNVKELTEASLENDVAVEQVFDEFSQNLADFLSPWLKSYDAEAIVIGGSIAKAWPFFASNLEKKLNSHNCFVKIFKSELQEKAILLGSARLVNDTFYKGLAF